jgi:glutamate-1-semialdehyde 2,1-aminomutase
VSALAGGGSSPVRAGAAVGGAPFHQARGLGAYAYDMQGRGYVDYVMAYGPLLFGHAHPKFVRGLDALAGTGTVFGSTCEEELHLAERVRACLPSMQRLRFVSTGTEAVMSAIRVARAFTKRSLIARFSGNYHGHFDGALHDAGASAGTTSDTGDVARSGIPAATRAQSVVARYNDLADLDAKLAGREDDLAAILVEPVVANMGLVLPDAGFVEALFARARACGALVIFDEVITWLRLGVHGGQAAPAPQPDLTALGKIMGGGFPLAAFGGREDVMGVLAPDGPAFTGGTFSGNPFCIAMGHRTLDAIEDDPDLYRRLDARARTLADGFRAIFADRGLPYAVVQHASMVDFAFRPGPPVRNFDERSGSDKRAFALYYHAMRERGVLLAPSSNELMFLSTEHGTREIDLTLEAADASLQSLLTASAIES